MLLANILPSLVPLYAQITSLFISAFNPDILNSVLNYILANPLNTLKFASEQYPETDVLHLEYDVIIVGAGAAGCVLANRLSEIPSLRILLIEAGDHESRTSDIPATAPTLQQSDIDWNYLMTPCDNCSYGIIDRKDSVPKGKVVGGSSTINYMIYTRGNEENYNRWETVYGNKGWRFEDVQPYFKKMEQYTVPDPLHTDYFGKDGPMHIQVSPARTNLSTAILKAAQESGARILNTNGPDQIGFSRLQSNVKDGYRFSANSAYLVPIAKSRPNLDLKLNCQVTKITFSNLGTTRPKANGIEYVCNSGEKGTVGARKEVILSAGVIGSPQLLMLSGIGPKAHLEELSIPLVKDLPVGDNLMDHVSLLTFLTIDKPQLDLVEGVVEYISSQTGLLSIPALTEVIGYTQPLEDGRPLMEYFFISVGVNPIITTILRIKDEIVDTYKGYASLLGLIAFPTLLQPRSRGYVRLRGSYPLIYPEIVPNFLSYPEEVEIFLKSLKDLMKIIEQPSLKALGTRFIEAPLPNCRQYPFLSDDYLRCFIRTLSFSIYHQCGTCKMGPEDDPTNVVSSELKVHGVDGLRVVDASIMPEIVCGHLHAPTLMIAEKASDYIKADL